MMISLRNRSRPSVNRDTCEARIVVWPPHLDDDGIAGVATCDHPADHPDIFHKGPIDSHDLSTTRVSWLETDRRTFRGPLRMCTYSRCCLPHAHRGDHAL